MFSKNTTYEVAAAGFGTFVKYSAGCEANKETSIILFYKVYQTSDPFRHHMKLCSYKR